MNFSRTKALVAALAMAAGAVLGGSAFAADPLKVGFVYLGPPGDHGWTYRHDIGRKAVDAAFGDKVKTTIVENVAEGADAERVIRQLAASGHGLIFTTSFGYMEQTLRVAKQYPGVKFEHATGYKRADNVSTYSIRYYEGRYVLGHIAGKMTKSNIIGYVAAFPIPEVIRGINATLLGARKVNPDVTIKVIWLNTWYDPGKERDAATTLIGQGADVLLQHTDSPAPVQVAEERGVYAFGQASDNSKFGPNAHLTANVNDWDPYYVRRVQAVLDGTWTSTDTWEGFSTDMLQLAPYNAALPADVVKMAEDVRKGIADGSIHPFTGPVRNQDGELVLKEGEVASDGMLLGMNFYVEGIEGKLPN